MDPLFSAYVAVTAALVLTPGSTTVVVVRSTIRQGRRGGMAAALGAAAANATHAAAAGLGLAVVFARWPGAMSALRTAGAAYLTWLGARSVYRTLAEPDGRFAMNDRRDEAEAATAAPSSSFRDGLAVNLLNPAIAAFYLVVVPSFIPARSSQWHFAMLAAIHVSMALLCHTGWVMALDRARDLLRPPRARRALEAITGLALIALAMRVLLA